MQKYLKRCPKAALSSRKVTLGIIEAMERYEFHFFWSGVRTAFVVLAQA